MTNPLRCKAAWLTRLLQGTALSGAVLAPGGAFAQCVPSGDTLTCSGDDPNGFENEFGDGVTLNVAPGATVGSGAANGVELDANLSAFIEGRVEGSNVAIFAATGGTIGVAATGEVIGGLAGLFFDNQDDTFVPPPPPPPSPPPPPPMACPPGFNTIEFTTTSYTYSGSTIINTGVDFCSDSYEGGFFPGGGQGGASAPLTPQSFNEGADLPAEVISDQSDPLVLEILENAGLIEGGQKGVDAEAGRIGAVTNSGTIRGVSAAGVSAESIGDVVNEAAGVIVSDGVALLASGSIASVDNAGAVNGGAAGLSASALGHLENAENAEITASAGDAVAVAGAVGAVGNSGLIAGDRNGVMIGGALGVLDNRASGMIQATTGDAVAIGADADVVNNFGTITAGRHGLDIGGAIGLFQNDVGAIIAGDADEDGTGAGVRAGTIADFLNAGTIAGAHGVETTGALIGRNDGVISGTDAGIVSGALSLTNAGVISSAGDGVRAAVEGDPDAVPSLALVVEIDGSITGDADGDGLGVGVLGGAGDDRVDVAGLIEAGGEDGVAIDFGAGDDVLVLREGFSFGDDRVLGGDGFDEARALFGATDGALDLSFLGEALSGFEAADLTGVEGLVAITGSAGGLVVSALLGENGFAADGSLGSLRLLSTTATPGRIAIGADAEVGSSGVALQISASGETLSDPDFAGVIAIENAGAIVGGDGGVSSDFALDLTNSGVIDGGFGIGVLGGAFDDVVRNSGTIAARGDFAAVDLGEGDDILILSGEAMFEGQVLGGSGDNVAILDFATESVFDITPIGQSILDFGVFEKNNDGLLTLIGSGGSGVTLSLNAGVTQLDGLWSGDVTVTDAILQGIGFVGGSVTVGEGGAINPGASPGTLTIGGDVTLNAGSELVFEFAADGSSDVVIIGGNLNLNGGVLRFTPIDDEILFLEPITVEVLDADAILGDLTNIQNDFTLINLDIQINAANGTIGATLLPNLPEGPVTDALIQTGLTGVLASVAPLSDTEQDVALAQLTSQNAVSTTQAAALSTLPFLSAIGAGSADFFEDPTTLGVSDAGGGGETGGLTIGASPFFGRQSVDGSDGRPGYVSDNQGLAINALYNFENGWKAGGGFGYGRFEADSDDGVGRTAADTFSVGGVLHYERERFFARAGGGYTRFVDAELERSLETFGLDSSVNSSFGANAYSFSTRGQYVFDPLAMLGGVRFRPFAFVDYARFTRNAFTEIAPDGATIEFDQLTYDSAVIGAGSAATWRFTRGRWSYGPSFYAGVNYQAGDEAAVGQARFVNDGTSSDPFTVAGPEVGRAAGRYGFQFIVKPDFIPAGLGVAFDGEVTSSGNQFNARLKLARRF